MIDSIDDPTNGLKNRNLSTPAFAKISVTCYHSSLPAGICAGGGDFDRILFDAVNPPCNATNLDNGATLIQDDQHDCFYRKNFGVNGVVDARQCGVYGDGQTHSPSDGELLNACLQIAANLKAVKSPTPLTVVNTGGGIVLVNSGDLEIPSNVALTCGGPPGGQRPQITPSSGGATPYYTLPSSIVLNPAHTIRRDRNSLFENCIVLPSWYNQSTLSAVTDTRSLIDKIEKYFSGTATTCGGINPDGTPGLNGEACDMRDVMILGFDVCDDTANASRAVLQNLKYECNVGEFLHANGGGTNLQNLDVHNFIEAQMNVQGGGLDIAGKDISKTEWLVQSITQSTSGEVQLTINTTGNPSQIVNGDIVLLAGTAFGSGPQSQNGRWLAECSAQPPNTCATFSLTGSSWVGPSFAGSWTAGSNTIVVPDTTNIAGGQFLCDPASGTAAPFCTPPPGFGAAPTTITGSTGLMNDVHDLPRLQVGSTANWPASGLVQIDTEYIGFALIDATHIQITLRGADNKSVAAHNPGATVTPSAPLVIAPIPSVEKVVVNATPISGGAQNVNFLNDPFIARSAYCGAHTCGSVILNANYRTWTANKAAGSTPDGTLTDFASGTGQNAVITITNGFKVQSGMAVHDLSSPPLISDTTVQSVSGNSVTLTTPPSGSNSFSNEKLQFSGCGYPTGQYWLGNCAATAVLFYGNTAANGAVGTACDTIHAHGWRVYMHMNNGQETVCNKMIFDSGSNGNVDDNDTADPTSVGIWVEGSGDKIELAQGKAEARTGFLNTGTTENNGVALSNFNLTTSNPNSIVFANTGRSNLAQLHGAAIGVGYADSSEVSLTLTGNVLQSTQIYFADLVSTPPTVFCANNSFATTFCSNLLQNPAAGGGLPNLNGAGGSSTISGSDGAGWIVAGLHPGTVITLIFAHPWANTPVCFAQDETTRGSNPIYAAPTTTQVVFNFTTAASQGDQIAYQCTGF